MTDTHPEPRKILYVMLRHTRDPEKLRTLLDDHLHWMANEEKHGRVFLSGPTEPAPGTNLNGLTVIQAASREDAEALARTDPLVHSGAVEHTMHEWAVNEGRIALTIHLSARAGSLD